ncbi:unnamed protein product, partial [Pleuronectes platessa]
SVGGSKWRKWRNPSPTKLPSIDDTEVEGVRRALMIAAYTCRDDGVDRREVYALNLEASDQAMSCLIKNVRLRRAAQQQAASYKAQLAVMKGSLKEALQQVEVLQACAVFSNDGCPWRTGADTRGESIGEAGLGSVAGEAALDGAYNQPPSYRYRQCSYAIPAPLKIKWMICVNSAAQRFGVQCEQPGTCALGISAELLCTV